MKYLKRNALESAAGGAPDLPRGASRLCDDAILGGPVLLPPSRHGSDDRALVIVMVVSAASDLVTETIWDGSLRRMGGA